MSAAESKEREASSQGDSQRQNPAEGVLSVVQQLVLELHPHRRSRRHIGLDARLDRDLGIDSLGRVELLYRLERGFGVSLPQQLLGSAETVGDLAQAVAAAPAQAATVIPQRIEPAVVQEAAASPFDARTLTEVLDWHAEKSPSRPHIVLEDDEGTESIITYRDLAEEARRVARGLRGQGFGAGDRAAIMLPTCREFFTSFFGILYAGGTPVPIYPPMRMSQIQDHLERQSAILNNAQVGVVIADPRARPLSRFLKARIPTARDIETPQSLADASEDETPLPRSLDPQQIALLQYTSGSTGDPKGVILTHSNLLANIRAIGEAIDADSSDVFVSWLPLYHDMGLIGAWLGSLYFAAKAVIMSPLSFLSRPERWLRAMHRHGATLTAAPNFAFELCLRRIEDRNIEGVDLSALRMAMNGAEPVIPETIRKFTARFAAFDLRPEAMAPVYGMAENSVGLAFPPLSQGPVIDRVQRDLLRRSGRAEPAAADDAGALEFVACGRALGGHEIRILDSTGREAGERTEGRVQFRGPSATSGYYRNTEKNPRALRRRLAPERRHGLHGCGVALPDRSLERSHHPGRSQYPSPSSGGRRG